METYETITKSGYTLKIYIDEYPESPRDWDNLGTLYIPRPPRGYSLSDKGANAADASAAPVQIPVYILDHSGLAISPTAFNDRWDRWDSWEAGIYYVTADKIRKEYGKCYTPEKALQVAEECARGELAAFSDYIAGDVYGYTIENAAGDELENVGGYYGADGLECIRREFSSFIGNQFKEDFPLFAWAGMEAAAIA